MVWTSDDTFGPYSYLIKVTRPGSIQTPDDGPHSPWCRAMVAYVPRRLLPGWLTPRHPTGGLWSGIALSPSLLAHFRGSSRAATVSGPSEDTIFDVKQPTGAPCRLIMPQVDRRPEHGR